MITLQIFTQKCNHKRLSSSMNPPQHGFTLTELLVTLTILTVITAFAAPSFVDSYRRSQARNLGDDLLSSLTYSRQQAISTNQCVTICMVTNPQATTPNCRTTGDDWERGWLVFSNPLCDNNPYGDDAEILQIHNGVASAGPTITPSSSGAVSRRIRFNPLGSVLLQEAKGFALQAQGSSTIQSNVCVARTGRITRNAQVPPDTCVP
jgi:type IV fimbrial biogenesis protein FimT